EVEEIPDQALERGGLLLGDGDVACALLRPVVEPFFQPLQVAAEGEEGGSQVVYDCADEESALVLELRLLSERGAQLGAHRLKGGVDLGHFADARGREPNVEVTGRDLPGRLAGGGQRADDGAPEEPADPGKRQQQADQPDDWHGQEAGLGWYADLAVPALPGV